MANNPYVNKVVYGGQTLIDLTGLAITAEDIADGYTTHNSEGRIITGVATESGCLVYPISARTILEIPTLIASVDGTRLILQSS